MKKSNWILIILVVLIASPLFLPIEKLATVKGQGEVVAKSPDSEQISNFEQQIKGDSTAYTIMETKVKDAVSQRISIEQNTTFGDLTIPPPRQLDPSKPIVALTFDDGPYTPVTDRLLNLLEKYGGRSTFFVVGNRVDNYHASVEKAVTLGCEISNHTYQHATLTKLNAAGVQTQMNDTDYAVWYYTGSACALMRPVGGSYNDNVLAAVGKPVIMWSLDTLDWKSRNANSVANAILNRVKDGDIVLMHDLYTSTADACDIVIPELVNRGYQLATVSELAAARGIELQPGVVYNNLYPATEAPQA